MLKSAHLVLEGGTEVLTREKVRILVHFVRQVNTQMLRAQLRSVTVCAVLLEHLQKSKVWHCVSVLRWVQRGAVTGTSPQQMRQVHSTSDILETKIIPTISAKLYPILVDLNEYEVIHGLC